jgi:hypothetical protein
LSDVFLDKYEKENRAIGLHLAAVTLLIQTFKDSPEISFGFGGTDNARTLIYEPGLGLAQMQKCIEY